MYASHFVLTEKIGGNINVMNLTQIQLTAVALMALAFTFVFDLPNLDFHKLIKSRIILEFLFLGVISIGFGYWTQFLAQTALSSATIAIVTCMESLFAAAFSVALGFEAFTLAMGVGGTIVLVSTIRAALEPIAPQTIGSKTDAAKQELDANDNTNSNGE
ncbi:MAG: DMT family transporter [Thermoguttaceae bacterium]|nr:DMT family transporter [Thermoguttaceae bacterium]